MSPSALSIAVVVLHRVKGIPASTASYMLPQTLITGLTESALQGKSDAGINTQHDMSLTNHLQVDCDLLGLVA